MPTRLFFRLSTMAASLTLLGCSFVPPRVLPDFDVSGDYREAVAPAQAALPWKLAASQALAGDPWQIFDLPELPGLLVRLDEANANLALARARYDQAAALIGQARAGLFPTVSGAATVTRARASGGSGSTTSDSVSLGGSWEFDLWGRVRAGVEASEASAKASAADLAGVRLSLQAQLAQALLSLRVVDAQRQLLDATVADYQRYVQLTADRVRFGVASRADLALAESQLHSAEAQSIETDLQRARLEHALAVLVGETPAHFSLPSSPVAAGSLRAPLIRRDPAVPAREARVALAGTHAGILDRVPTVPVVPLSAPSTLLERRPDISAAERRVAVANTQVGVAQAAFFPVLELTGSVGQRAAGWGDLLTAPARFWSVGPALAAPLFDAGLRNAQKAEAVAAWQQASANYRQTVLAAFQEVEDQLASLRILADQARVENEAVKAARVGAELTLAQYRAGTAASLQVIVTNNALLLAERAALDLHSRRLDAAVVLIRALGGGWDGEEREGRAGGGQQTEERKG